MIQNLNSKLTIVFKVGSLNGVKEMLSTSHCNIKENIGVSAFPEIFLKMQEKIETLEELAKEKNVPLVRSDAWFMHRDMRNMLQYFDDLTKDSDGFNVTLWDMHERTVCH